MNQHTLWCRTLQVRHCCYTAQGLQYHTARVFIGSELTHHDDH
ncbi:hypothetical protein ACF1FC_13370 [Streptomyces sp. NPDC014344]